MITAGIDVGSSAIKAAVVADDGRAPRVLALHCERIRRRDPHAVAADAFAAVRRLAGVVDAELGYVATTGEGEGVAFRTGHFYGMTTHARGGLFLDAEARAVIDVGAFHARAVLIDERGKVLGSRMTSQCASGSGQFLENICRYLGVTIEEIGPLSLRADAPEPCSSICAVLAETDVINMVSRGVSIPNIVGGIHASMASRCVKLLLAAGARGIVLVTGGLSRDAGLLAAMQRTAAEMQAPISIRTHQDAVHAGAIGAALWGAFRARKLQAAGAR
jgi:benzoyl-CoA reductase subunit D